MLRKATVLVIVVTLILASLPITGVLAKGNNEMLEAKWDQLITNFNRQSFNHNGVHNWVAEWLYDHKNASASQKAEVRWHLAICNSALASAQTIVWRHAGFDASGNVIDRGLAIKSIKDLGYYLQKHAGSVKNLQEHIK